MPTYSKQFESQWLQVSQSIDKISNEVHLHCIEPSTKHKTYKLKYSVTWIYSIIYNLCTEKPSKSEYVYNKMKEHLQRHMTSYSNFIDKDHRIEQFNQIWISYTTFMFTIFKRIFSHLSRYYMAGTEDGELTKTGLQIFFNHTLAKAETRIQFVNNYLYLLGQTRDHLIINNQKLKEFCQSVEILSKTMYEEIKETFVRQTLQYYIQKYEKNQHLKPIEYLHLVNNLSIFEQELISRSCTWTGEEKFIIMALFERQLVLPFTDQLLRDDQGRLISAIRHKNIQYLNIVLEVYSKFEGFQKIRKTIYDFIVSEGIRLTETINHFITEIKPENEQFFIVEELCDFFNSYMEIVSVGFKKNQQIYLSMNNAFEIIIAKYEKLPDLLYKYTRKVLEKEIFGSKLASIRLIFQKIPNKDEFIHNYESEIEKLIISNKFDHKKQKQYIDFLHEICGSEFTFRLMKKVEDYLENNSTALNHCLTQGISPEILKPTILSFQLWEKRFVNQISLKINLVQPLTTFWQQFETKILELNPASTSSQNAKKRKLLLLPFESKLILDIKFIKKPLRIRCNLLQACILFSLVSGGQIIQDLVFELNIERSILLSLFQEVPFVALTTLQKYQINWEYENTTADEILDIDSIVHLENKFSKSIDQDRSILLEAFIVKFAKRKKETTFSEIFTQLCQKIHLFKPQPAAVKTTIQKLIKKEFLDEGEDGIILYKQ